MKSKIKSFEEVCRITKDLQKKNKKIVFVHGIFDILHKGHVYLLTEAKKLGDTLIVGVECDENSKVLKGKNRPINDQESRMFVLSSLAVTDYVFLIENFKYNNTSQFYLDIYKKLRPNIIATSLSAGNHGKHKKRQALETGTEFVDLSNYIHNKNTTKTLEILGLE